MSDSQVSDRIKAVRSTIAMMAKAGSLRPFNWFFLLGLAPLVSLIYLTTIKDPVFGADRDFGVFWTAATLMWDGQSLRLFDPDTFRAALSEVMGPDFPYLPFPYPPHTLFLLAPLVLFPYLISLALWLGATFAAIVAALWNRVDRRWPMVLGLLICPASAVNMAGGQNGFLSASLLGGGLLLLERRPLLAGLLFGLLSYKPQLGLLIPLLLISAGHWRAFWAAAVTVIVLVASSAVLFGSDAWLLYATKSGPLQLEIAQHWVGRFQFMSPTYFMAARLLGLELWQAWTVQGLATVLALAASVWAFRQKVPHGLKSAVAMVAVFLVSPYALTYDMMIVTIAILVAAQYFIPKWWECVVFALAWILPALTLPEGMPIGPIIVTAVFMILLRHVEQMAGADGR